MPKINYNSVLTFFVGASVFCLPFTQLGIGIGGFSLTFSDILLLVAFGLMAFFPNKYKVSKEYGNFLLILLLFIVTILFTIIKAVEPIKTVLNTLPWIYAMIFLIVLGRYNQNPKFLKYIYGILFVSLALSVIPSYLNIVGINIPRAYFHSLRGVGVRYSYFTINPNQYAAYLLTASSFVALYMLKFRRHSLPRLLILFVFMMFPMLETGSRTGVAIFGLIVIILFFLVYSDGSFKRKTIMLSSVAGMILVLVPLVVTLMETNVALRRSIIGFAALGGETENAGTEKGIAVREEQFNIGFELQRENPFMGVGLGNFKFYHHHEIHNTYIAMFSETGIIGISIFFILLMYPYWIVLKSSNSITFKALASILLFAFYLTNLTHVFMRERWTWVFLGGLILITTCMKNINHSKNSKV